MITIAQAVMSLRPGVEWSLNNDNVEGIIWHTPNVQPLTQAEVAAEVVRLEAEAANKVQSELSAIRDAQEELKALGLSDTAVATISGHPYPNIAN
jgi:hypothetical protein